jgi:hypothetical protein
MPETSRDQLEPRIQQVSLFLPNRVGSLRRAVHLLESRDIVVGGISVLEATDHGVVRMVVNRPDGAYEILSSEGYGACLTDLLAVALPRGPRFGVQRVLSVLLSAEVNLEYAYGLILQAEGLPLIALQVDDLSMAGRVLMHKGFTLVGQDQLEWPESPKEV